MTSKTLSLKHKTFCELYIKYKGNGTKAYIEVYKSKNINSAAVLASRLLKDVNIIEYINYLNDEIKSDKIADLQEIQIELSNIIRDKKNMPKDKIAASKLLLESQGELIQKLKVDSDVKAKVQNIFDGIPPEKLIEMSDKFEDYLTDDDEGVLDHENWSGWQYNWIYKKRNRRN